MKVAVIGAGITGLSAAYLLTKNGHQVTIFERGDTPGGLGTYIKVSGTYIERYYHHFFEGDSFIKQFSKELGIEKKLKFYEAKSSVYKNGGIHPLNSAKDLLNFKPLPYLSRLTCGLSTAFFKFSPHPPAFLDKISAKDWVIKSSGKKVYDNLWGPLIEGKFSGFADRVPAMWLWGRIHDRSFKLGYFDGSVKVLFDQLVKAIKEKGGELKLNSEVKKIKEKGDKVFVKEGRKVHQFDKLIITTVSPIAAKILGDDLPKNNLKTYQSLDHLGAVCLILELKYSIQQKYWVNICDPGMPVLVMVEQTRLTSPAKYGGRHIVYLANYLHRSDPRFLLPEKEIIDSYTSMLKTVNKNFKKDWIIKAHLSRVPRAQTIFQINALKKLPKIKTGIKNVFMVNIDQMYPHDRNLNQGIELAHQAVAHILKP